MSWIQELEINIYSLNPYSDQQLTTDTKVLFPNLHASLYGPAAPSIDYECARKYCTFCLRTNYEDNVADIAKNKNWHCHHCTGYCMCTRCQR